MSFIITVDSMCNITDTYTEKHDIRIIPFSYSCDGNIYCDTADSPIRSAAEISTHAPEIAEYVDFWRRILSEGQPVLHISAGSLFEQAYANAFIARDILTAQNRDAEIYIIDSCSVSCGCTLLLYKAVRMRFEGIGASDCAGALDSFKKNINGFVISRDAVSSYKSGLLSFPSMLRAAITGEDTVHSVSDLFGGVFFSHCAPEQVSELAARCCSENSMPLCISYSGDRAPAEKLARMLSVRYGFRNIELFSMNTTQSSLLSEGTIALFFHGLLKEEFPAVSRRRCPAERKFIPKPVYL